MPRAPKRGGKASLKVRCQGCKDEVTNVKNACSYCKPVHLSYDRCENHTITTSGGYLVFTFHNRNGIFWVWSETQHAGQYKLICKDWNRGTQGCDSECCGKCAEEPIPTACDPHKCKEVKKKIIMQVARSRERKAADEKAKRSDALPPAKSGQTVEVTTSNANHNLEDPMIKVATKIESQWGSDFQSVSPSTYSIVSANGSESSIFNPCETPRACSPHCNPAVSSQFQTTPPSDTDQPTPSNPNDPSQPASSDAPPSSGLYQTFENGLENELANVARDAQLSWLKGQSSKLRNDIKRHNDLENEFAHLVSESTVKRDFLVPCLGESNSSIMEETIIQKGKQITQQVKALTAQIDQLEAEKGRLLAQNEKISELLDNWDEVQRKCDHVAVIERKIGALQAF